MVMTHAEDKDEKIVVSEQDKMVINLIKGMDDIEIFGLQCFLMGRRSKDLRSNNPNEG